MTPAEGSIWSRSTYRCAPQKIRRVFHAFFGLGFGLGLTLALSACQKAPQQGSTAVADGEAYARRVASSFARCVEQSGATCVGNSPQMRAFDAVALMQWMHEASPVALLAALPAQVRAQQDFEGVQSRFARFAQQARVDMRGAGCTGAQTQPFPKVTALLARSLRARMQQLGLYDAQISELITELDRQAKEGLKGGYAVQVECSQAPELQFMAAVASSQGRLQVLGMTVGSIDAMMGRSPKTGVADRPPREPTVLAQGVPDRVHPWISASMEAY